MKFVQALNHKLGLDEMPRVRKFFVGVIGVTVLLIGVALIVLPGPAIIVIPAGLAILATEFAWARSLIERAKSIWKRERKS